MIVSVGRYDRESVGECHLILEVSPCVSTQERPSQSWIVSFKRLGCTSCLNTITSFSPCIHPTHTHMHTHKLNILHLFCFWELHMGALCLLCSPYLSKLDAGPGCLTASVKLWCGRLILASMHFDGIYYYYFKKGRGDRLNGGICFSGSSRSVQDQWRVKDGWRVLDRDLKSPRFPITHSWGMVLPDEWSLLRRRS